MEKHIPSRRWTNKIRWRRSGTENIHLDTGTPNRRRKSKKFSWRIRRVSSTTSRLTSGCRWSDKTLLVHVRKLHLTAIILNPESHFTRREESVPIPLKYIDVSRTTHTNLDVMQESRIDDDWNIDGSRDLSDSSGQVSLSSLYEVRNLEKDMCGPGGHWQNGKRHPGQIIYGQNSGEECQRTLSWGRSIKGQSKNQSSIMKEDYEEFISLTLRTRSSKKPLGMLERNWKHQWLPLCLARHARKVA